MTGLFALTLMAGFAVNTHAQETADVTVGATVLEDLEVTNVTDLEFGFVQTGTVPIANANAADLASAFTEVVEGGPARSIGQVTVEGNEGADVIVEFPQTLELESDDGDPIQFNAEVIFLADTTTDTETAAGDGTDVTESGDHDYNIAANGDSFFLGGSLTATDGSSSLPPDAEGEYSGTITFSASFN